jgi:hypothetical protein
MEAAVASTAIRAADAAPRGPVFAWIVGLASAPESASA